MEGNPSGPLASLAFAAKDIFDVAGHVTGGGNPDWKGTHAPAQRTAWVVQTLVDAGATMVGKTHTDELTRGIFGENAHYGTPTNPRSPNRVPGGSSSGLSLRCGWFAGRLRPRLRHWRLGTRALLLLRPLRPAPHPRAHPAARHPDTSPQL